ncbi:MAG: hypothetical protein NTY69_05190 [Methylococcales bacterium]|nr:hypothetical protein [Methylococcales bacterium]
MFRLVGNVDMVIYRKFLLNFLVVVSFCISTFSINSGAEIIVDEGVKSQLNSVPLEQAPKSKKKSRKKTVVITPPIQIDPDVLYKPLDLSVPFNDQENYESLIDKNKSGQSKGIEYFDSKPKVKRRPLELNGGFLMSPEPEIEKKKTVDGAGISINLKPD